MPIVESGIESFAKTLNQIDPFVLPPILSYLDKAWSVERGAVITVYNCALQTELQFEFSSHGVPVPKVWNSVGGVTFSGHGTDYTCRWYVKGRAADVLAVTPTHTILGQYK